MANEQFSLCWDNFHKSMSSAMNSLLTSEDLVDVTLAIEGQYIKAHKFILSACSPYFRTLFSINPCKHPIIFMKDVSYIVMSDLLTFMYQGEVQVSKENLATFISTAESLQIKGLTGDKKNVEDAVHDIKMKRPALVEELPTKTTKQQSVENPTKKTKLSSTSEKRETIASPPVETPMEIKPEFFSCTTITNDCVDIKSENYESNPDEEVNDINFDINQVTDYIENRMCGKDYSMEQEETQAGTSGDGMGDSQEEVRLVRFDHMPIWNRGRLRCKYPYCTRRSYVTCSKCKVSLCLNKDRNCFLRAHTG